MMWTSFYLSISPSLLLAILCSRFIFLASASSADRVVLRVSKDYELLEMVPHDTSSFTQGLTYFNGHIYEGTGLEHQSHIFQHDPSDSMTTLRKIPLAPANFFGEGVAYYYTWANDGGDNMSKEHRLIQLTWKNKRGYIYSLDDGGNSKNDESQSENSSHLKVIREFDYDTVTGEGWGITFLPHTNEFYISDGSHFLSVWDAESLDLKRKIPVKFERKVMVDGELKSESLDVDYINELEFVDFETGGDGDGATDRDSGEEGVCLNDGTECNDDTSSPHKQSMRILANVWYQDLIISIHPETGEVERVYDFRDLYPIEQRQKDGADVLNGISLTGTMNAGGEDGVELWITGKLWPNMYRVRLKQHVT